MLNVVFSYCYAEYHYAKCLYTECCYAECRGAIIKLQTSSCPIPVITSISWFRECKHNRREPKSYLGRVFNYKVCCFDLIHELSFVWTHALIYRWKLGPGFVLLAPVRPFLMFIQTRSTNNVGNPSIYSIKGGFVAPPFLNQKIIASQVNKASASKVFYLWGFKNK